MKYMLLIYTADRPAPEARAAAMPAWIAYTEELQRRKAYVAAAPLAEPSSATTVRAHSGKRTVTDGPFAEKKEWLGGYYLIEAESLDQAIEAAAMCPAAKYGSIEVRPIDEM
ncbi:MAG: YciI family protein [Candidatus Eremiobacteraeota bacterium]|nr:YciI family protein [Candidatus Eremiobacteraeota bacterium]